VVPQLRGQAQAKIRYYEEVKKELHKILSRKQGEKK